MRGLGSMLLVMPLVLPCACSSATEIVVVVDTELDVPGEIDSFRVITSAADPSAALCGGEIS